jgi:homeodomain-containing protein
MVFRACLILECTTGADNVRVAKRLGTIEQTVTLWRGRFLEEGMGGLADLARSGRSDCIKRALKGGILSEAVGASATLGRWSTRSMARHLGVSKATVQRVWSTNDIKPHRTRIFKLSCDEQFEAKFWDVIGVFGVNPLIMPHENGCGRVWASSLLRLQVGFGKMILGWEG